MPFAVFFRKKTVTATESALTFTCHDQQLIGIHHSPQYPKNKGVLIVVGGPQYRAGSHRSFVLLARHLAHNGYPVFRFDYRGMGDSEGEARTFEGIDDDIRCALNAFSAASPNVSEFILWGLCDAASASLYYCGTDARVTGLVLVNPWIRTTQAQTVLKHYYVRRLAEPAFWKKFVSDGFYLFKAAGSLFNQLRLSAQQNSREDSDGANDFSERMLSDLRRFKGPVLIVLCGNDLTAKEFKLTTGSSSGWLQVLKESRFSTQELAGADHTFSSQIWRDQISVWTVDWLAQKFS